MSEYCIVLTTFENKEQGKPVIDTILQEQLVACVQEVGIQSHYVWKNELCNDNEILVLMKTTNELYEVLKNRLLEIHPYETPEIVRVDIADGSTGYLSWIKEVTR
jgi:periplasmic divalent cation tolerance protein